jgi:hypothetical protein
MPHGLADGCYADEGSAPRIARRGIESSQLLEAGVGDAQRTVWSSSPEMISSGPWSGGADDRKSLLDRTVCGVQAAWLSEHESSHSTPQPGMEGSAMTYLRTIRRPKLRWIVTAALLVSLAGWS